MFRIPRTFLLSALLSLSAAVSAGAQTTQLPPPPFRIRPLEANNPLALRATGFVTPVLGGKSADAERYLRAHGTQSWVAGNEMKAQLADAVEQLANKGYRIGGVDQLGPDLIGVRIHDSSGETASAVLVRMDPQGTHKIRSIQMAPGGRMPMPMMPLPPRP